MTPQEELKQFGNVDCQFCFNGKATKMCYECYKDDLECFLCEECYSEHKAINTEIEN